MCTSVTLQPMLPLIGCVSQSVSQSMFYKTKLTIFPISKPTSIKCQKKKYVELILVIRRN